MIDITNELMIEEDEYFYKVFYQDKHIGLKHKNQDLYILSNNYHQVLNKITKVYKNV